jgi:hypothetical protein
MMRDCTTCGEIKPLADFYKGTGKHGRIATCIPCSKIARHRRYREDVNGERTKSRAYYAQNKDRICKQNRTRKFGLSIQEQEERLERQHNRCAICKEPFGKRWNVDHDHKTGKIRDLLCDGCNGGLGLFKDDVTNLHLAAAYLERHR